MPPIIGIDLGTTFSAVALVGQIGKPEIIPNREGERLTPSVVLFQDDAALVGEVARRSATTAPYDVVQFVKRQMGNPDWRFTASDGKQYGAEQVSSIILRRLKEDAALVIGEPVTDAVITVPAYFDDARRKATQDAGVITGLNVRRVLNEPTAAALAYGLDSRASGTVLVYDLGGGTFDVTVMRIADGVFDVIATMGDRNLGGFDWDNALMTYVNEQVMGADGPDVFDDDLLTAELREKGELLKRSLSSLNRAKLFLPAGGTVHTVEITRDTFEHITQGLLGRTEDITGQALDDANLGWPDIDHVLLVGGSTRMPMVRRMMERISSREPERGVNPDEAVALGAAVQAHLCAMADTGGGAGLPVLAGTDGKHVVVRDVAALGLGVLALDDGQLQRNWVLVPHNAKVPGWGSGDFNTVVENQQEIRVQVTEGDDPDPSYVKVVGDSVFQMPPYPKGAPIRIDINFDIDGIIHAQAFDATTGVKLGDMEIERISNLAPHEVKQARQNVEQLEIS